MRVISGSCKGRVLKSVPGNQTRPTTDKVKESIFNMIGPYFHGGVALDLFAGSGGVGIEALSRGMDKAIFVDRHPKAIQTIKQNVSLCKLEDKSEIYRNDAFRALKALIKRQLTFDCVFLDPPYKQQELEKILHILDNEQLVNENGFVVCEHEANVQLPNEVGQFQVIKKETYGIIGITIFQRSAQQ
jgi:16S rRNA (guanine966-N2)-methyltransferase